MNNTFKQNTVYAIFFKLQLIYSTVRTWMLLLLSYYAMTHKQVNDIFKQNSLNAIVFKLQLIYTTVITESSYCSAMQLSTGLQFCYVIAD